MRWWNGTRDVSVGQEGIYEDGVNIVGKESEESSVTGREEIELEEEGALEEGTTGWKEEFNVIVDEEVEGMGGEAREGEAGNNSW